ncbi:TetR/AcrR family transcriptional regulator [Pectinatus frisingensis]|uniref:TetR/AcrR family transcriptional regulator n=1 Tax=Pectinatus frisingensis TaxID=865 RepID=UPI0018C7F67A|nr:TetR/AcrR family transcriptional regulator [Pectinatus frisingensis]
MNTKNNSREKIVGTASDLFQSQGFYATGLNEIIKKSGSPKGSLYYYFPEGKEELGVAAVKFAGRSIQQKIKDGLDRYTDPILAINAVIKDMITALKQDGKLKNTSLSLVALETYLSSEALRTACSESFSALENIYAQKLLDSGVPKERAEQLGIVIQSLMEGAILLSVTHHDTTALGLAAKQIEILLKK